MFSDVNLNVELSVIKFGEIPKESGSHKLCCVECLTCHKIIEREYRNRNKKHQCSVVDGNNKRCVTCKEWKDLSLFNKSYGLSGGVSKTCRECYNKYDCVTRYNKNKSTRLKTAFIDDFDSWIAKRTYQLKSRCKHDNILFDLTPKDLKHLWQLQDGYCYYSGLKMIADGRINGFQGWLCPSIDRKTPNLGYIPTNIVWCCFSINSFKQNLTEEEFIEQVKKIEWSFEGN